MSGSFRKAKGQRPAACSAPRGASRGCSAGDEAGQGDAGRLGWPGAPRPGPALTRKAGQRRPCPHRHTRPCHVLLHASWRPAFGGWHARHPDWRPGWGGTEESLVRQRAAAAGGVRRPEGWTLTWPPVRAEAPIAAPSRPALARLGHGLRSPVPRLTAASSQLPTPVCARLPPPRVLTHSAPPASPHLVLACALGSPGCCTVCHASPGGRAVRARCRQGRRALPARPPGRSATWGRRILRLGPSSLLAAGIPEPRTEAAAASRWCPAAGLPAHCAFRLALLPSRLRAGPGGPAGAAPEPSAK